MDKDLELILGGVYKTTLSEDPCRVLAFDDLEIFYDVYWPSLNKWELASNLKRQGAYYRQIPKVFLKNATLLRKQPLTTDEVKIFRPDLPLRLCRNKQMVWAGKTFDNLEKYKSYADQLKCDFSNDIVLTVPSITLRPFGAKGTVTPLKSTLVRSFSKKGFSCIELLWLANNIQSEHAKHIVEKGVGIYRSGHEKKVPSYYIWGYYDMGGSIPKEE